MKGQRSLRGSETRHGKTQRIGERLSASMPGLLAILLIFLMPAAGNGARLEDPIPQPIEQGSVRVKLETVAGGLTAPNWGVNAPGDNDSLYVSDQSGILWKINLTTGDRTVFLDVSDRLVDLGASGPGTFDERGFLGFDFHPDYMTNGLIYTYTSEPVDGAADFSTIPAGAEPNHQSVIAEWQVSNPSATDAVVDNNSARVLLRIDQPQFNHNAGTVNFGPDGLLYISLGDGGGADDLDGQQFRGEPIIGHGNTTGNGRNPSTILGTIIRIDPLGTNSANGRYGIPENNPFLGQNGFLNEIYAYGFRNPFRFSFDGETGELFAADVGQNDIEEVDIVTAGGNYGWNFKEGSFFFDPNGNEPGFVTDVNPGVPAGLIDPIAEYDHDEGLAVIGGFVYRGNQIPALVGNYVFGDFTKPGSSIGRLFYLGDDNRIREFQFADREELGFSLLGFGRDARGELYVLANETGTPFGDTGVVLRIVPECQAGGTEAGSDVSETIDTSTCDTLTLLLSRQTPAPAEGRLYVSVQALTIPDLAGLTFFRPSDDEVPLPGGGFVRLVKTGDGFLPDAGDFEFLEGPLGDDDLSFGVGTDGLQGQRIIFETLFVPSGMEFNEENLQSIQRVEIDFQ